MQLMTHVEGMLNAVFSQKGPFATVSPSTRATLTLSACHMSALQTQTAQPLSNVREKNVLTPVNVLTMQAADQEITKAFALVILVSLAILMDQLVCQVRIYIIYFKVIPELIEMPCFYSSSPCN